MRPEHKVKTCSLFVPLSSRVSGGASAGGWRHPVRPFSGSTNSRSASTTADRSKWSGNAVRRSRRASLPGRRCRREYQAAGRWRPQMRTSECRHAGERNHGRSNCDRRNGLPLSGCEHAGRVVAERAGAATFLSHHSPSAVTQRGLPGRGPQRPRSDLLGQGGGDRGHLHRAGVGERQRASVRGSTGSEDSDSRSGLCARSRDSVDFKSTSSAPPAPSHSHGQIRRGGGPAHATRRK